ncbi:MAG: adenylate/guanylate cyclase domain-containing protein [Cyanobacteriota bacterium SKYGB_h_bin112]|nr:adenylate/guanylate cyclase domain-containing protein [Cyanobacteriota bacterium SKYGB_h_bin112]
MEHSLGEAVDRRILIVGKPVDTLHLLTAMLADWGYGVAVTSDYGIASHTVQALAPDVILLSVSAGSADGYDVCDRLQADKTTRAIPILIVGEGDDPALRLQAFAVGAVDYIARRSTALEEIAARLDVHAVRCQTVRQLQQEIVQRDHALRQHQAIENRLELLLNLTQAISKAESFDAALEAALQLLGSATGWDYGEAWVESVDGLVLECNPSWYRRQLDIDATLAAAINEFRRFSEALTFAPHEGMPGRVWQGQHIEFINDMTVGSRSLFLRDDLAQMCGFRAALAVPILLPTSSPNLVRSTQRVLAVLCFFSSNAYPQDSYLLQLVSAVAAQLGTLLAQKQVEAEMRALFNAMTDVVLVQDASGRCIRVVPTNQNGLSLSLEQLVGKTLHETLPKLQADYLLTRLRQSLREQRPVTAEYSMRLPDGEHWYAATISPLNDALVVFVARDISDRIRIEQELAESRQFLDSIIENIPLAISVKDVHDDYRYVLWNRGAEAIYGIPRDQVIGHTDRDLLGLELAAQLEKEHQQLLLRRELVILDEESHLGVRPIWQRVRKLPLINDHGEVTHLLYIAEDISLRRQMEEALQQAEMNFRSIFENAVEGIYQVTPEGRYLSVNRAMARLYGYESPEDMISKVQNVAEQIYTQPYRWHELSAYLRHAGEVSEFESKVYCQDGTTFWVAENVRAVTDSQGKLLHYEGMVQDITARREAEEELRQQRRRAENLLLNVLPQPIAERLKRGEQTIADNFADVTVLFADLVNFTNLSTEISPADLVNLLNDIFSVFDDLSERHGLEKIKTIGDAYMVVGGLPKPRADHAESIADMALDMRSAMTHFTTPQGQPLSLRIGINTGAVVAGVIGKKKFIYDLWGDTVNIASRMESQGAAGGIQVTAATYERLKDKYLFETRGSVLVKGRGKMTTYWLVGKLAIT